ncbi:MAG: hypothetical protein EPO51_15135 [Phenylobacterium sp.]|uniref:hypothetical protein n=1 Tax=Phenylobacterium sp. TaxID=1871053 RepID=UPI0011FD2AC9|nr:hypothetical protein [Phenylobacterium sp.]TAJ71108.1 MAG: hypothetical protein EPO51_15135 [Phenylobacterium sp.]
MRRFLILGVTALIATGCATSPRQTVKTLDKRDPEYASRDCRQARRAVGRYDDNKDGRAVIAIAGNLVIPFAGSAAALAMSKMKDDERVALNERVRKACVSDPLGKRRSRVASR